MKTLTVISDTHGNMRKITELNAIFEECDYIVHLGDTSSDGARIRAQFPDKTILINGNCDPVKLGEDEKVIEIENVRIFSTPLFSETDPFKACQARKTAELFRSFIRTYSFRARRRSRRNYINQPRHAFTLQPKQLLLYCCDRRKSRGQNSSNLMRKLRYLRHIRGSTK